MGYSAEWTCPKCRTTLGSYSHISQEAADRALRVLRNQHKCSKSGRVASKILKQIQAIALKKNDAVQDMDFYGKEVRT